MANFALKNFEPGDEKWRIFLYTILQLTMAYLVSLTAAAFCVGGYIMGSFKQTHYGSQFMPILAALFIIGLVGGLIPKGDYAIHGNAELLFRSGDAGQMLRKKYRLLWLTAAMDALGLLPALGVFLWSILQIWHRWNFWFIPAGLVIIVLCTLLIVAVWMIPQSCRVARSEVAKQIEIYEAEEKERPYSIE
jgi:hypothetical protein